MPGVVTAGETMVLGIPTRPGRLRHAPSLELKIGGAESNLAIALSRLGISAGWVGHLPGAAAAGSSHRALPARAGRRGGAGLLLPPGFRRLRDGAGSLGSRELQAFLEGRKALGR
jgi:hypothetical protein